MADRSKKHKQDCAEVYVLPKASFDSFPYYLYIYVCSECGWWDISNGNDEVWGSLVRKAGPRVAPCERCQHTPMYLLKRDDLLRVVVESEAQ